MARNIPSKHHGIRLNLHTELAKQIQKYPNNRVGNHDHLGINKHQARIVSVQRLTTTWPPPHNCDPCPFG